MRFTKMHGAGNDFILLDNRGAQLSPDAETEFLDQAEATLPSTFLPLRKAVQNALLHFAETSKEAQVKVEKLLNR